MSYADQIFKEMCRDIIENGTSTEGEKVRTFSPSVLVPFSMMSRHISLNI